MLVCSVYVFDTPSGNYRYRCASKLSIPSFVYLSGLPALRVEMAVNAFTVAAVCHAAVWFHIIAEIFNTGIFSL